MRRTITVPVFLALAAMALTGCSAMSSVDQSGGMPAPTLEQGAEYAPADGSRSEAVTVEAAPADRQVITTGYVTVTVDDPMASAEDAVRIAEQAGGRVDGRNEYAPKDEGDKGSATLTLRIPADGLTATLDKLRALGTVEEVSLNSNDVTMATQDLDARITALSASIDRMLVLMSSATDTDTLIKLETAVSDRQAQLESLQSERRYYADQVSLSTVTLNLVSEYNAPAENPDTFLSGLEAGWNGFVAFFAGLLVALGVLVPWLVLAGIITFVVITTVRWNRRRKAAAPVSEGTPSVSPEE